MASPSLRSRPDHGEVGASAVEFAIVSGLLFMLIFGIIQFGIFFAQDLALSNGARQAARTAAVPVTGNCGEIYADAQQGAQTIALNQSDPSFDISVQVATPPAGFPAGDLCPGFPAPNTPGFEPCAGQAAGTEVQVIVEYDAGLALPLVGRFDALGLEREGTYRCEFS